MLLRRRALVAVSLLASLLAVPPAGGQDDGPFPPDTIAVGLEESTAANIDVTVQLAQSTFPDGGVQEVLIGRSDVFADSLASGVLQDQRPLLLVPTEGPVPGSVLDEIQRLGATTATILGGEAAVSQRVVEDLEGAGLSVRRLFGVTRIETAVEVARQRVPQATTAIVARAESAPGNATSGFADTLAAGGWAAEAGFPVLLTQTDELTASTADYLAGSSITTVNIVGGTAAVGSAVEQALRDMGMTVERVSGPDRASTALEIAKARGFDSAADAGRVIVVDGFSEDAWAAGFGAAAQAAGGAVIAASGAGTLAEAVRGPGDPGSGREGAPAPVVLGNIEDLPPATEDFLAEGPTAITCAVTAQVCDQARVEIGFAPTIPVEVPPGSLAYTVTVGDSRPVMAADFEGNVLGLVTPCHINLRNEHPDAVEECTEIDWTDRGDFLTVLQANSQPFAVEGLTLGSAQRLNASLVDSDLTYTWVDAYNNVDGRPRARTISSDGRSASTPLPANGGSHGPCGCVRQASFQAAQDRPEDGLTLFLGVGPDGNLNVESLPNDDDVEAMFAIQRRPGAQLLGAAFDTEVTNRIALTDVVGGQGELRIAPADPSGEAVVADVEDVSSTPFWGFQDSGVAVLADTGSGTALMVVDPDTGSAEEAVADAGPVEGDARISGDGSGSFLAWRTTTEIRIVDLRSGEVAILTPPEGQEIVGGPAFRP